MNASPETTPETKLLPKHKSKQGGLSKFKISPRMFKFLLNIYGPYIGAGVKVRTISEDFRFVRVEMLHHWYNTNYFNTHFGGSLYAMTDPFYLFMLVNNLGKGYVVWDKAAEIQFRSPGKGKVWCEFRLTEEEIATIKAEADANHKVEPQFTVEVFGEDGKLVASVLKTLYVRRVA